jgi:cell division protein FtsN
MNENGSQRPPLPRAAPILAIGVAVVLCSGFGLGIYVLRTPSAVLPPAAVLSPPPEAILPASEPSPPEVSVPPPAIVPTPAAIPPEPPAAPAIAPPPAVIVPAKPVAEPRPAKPVAERRHHRPAKPVLRHSAPRAVVPPPPKPTLLPDHKRWAIRVGAFQSDDHAKLLVDTLKFNGYPARIIQQRDRGGRGWFVVQTQDYMTRAEAQSAARLLADRVHVPSIIFERKEGG